MPGWLEKMPVLPLERAVPVRRTDGDRYGLVCDARLGGLCVRYAGDPPEYVADSPAIRVDLDDPQGFAYALRLYSGRWSDVAEIADRFWRGETTDADRLHLARALKRKKRGAR